MMEMMILDRQFPYKSPPARVIEGHATYFHCSGDVSRFEEDRPCLFHSITSAGNGREL